MIYLTSFFKLNDLPDDHLKIVPWSAAVYQPKGYNLPKAEWCDIRDAGKWTRPRDFIGTENPLQGYFDTLYGIYTNRTEDAANWLAENATGRSCALVCWCPYDRAAKRQLAEWGTFVCHTEVLRQFIEREFGMMVHVDDDRSKMKELP